jgi:hypothetical protein
MVRGFASEDYLFLTYQNQLMLYPDTYYHLYNHANGDDLLYRCDENYRFFLEKFYLHILPIADVYAYCLMPNHFHVMIKIKSIPDLLLAPAFEKLSHPIDINTNKDDLLTIQRLVSKSWGNLFNSYTQSFNKVYKRRGSLFIKNFKSKSVETKTSKKRLLCYIHKNPVKHRFTRSVEDWKWSSYHKHLSDTETILMREEVLSWFGNKEEFIRAHR